jgi:DNA-binding PadR family transcriptional regulator
LSTDRLTPFSYVILVLVGEGGAGPHDLKRNSQYYAEPKKLARMGLLAARKEPGKTRERTHYTLTEKGRQALADWVRTPAAMPRFQHETAIRILGADIVGPQAVADGLATLDREIDEWIAVLDWAEGNWRKLEHRLDLLEVNDRYARKLVDLQREWLRDARAALRHRGAKP